MTALVTSRQAGDSVAPADHNTLALAFQAMGVNNDDLGKLIVPLALGLPFGVMSSVGSVQAKAVGPSTAYVVPAGKLFYITHLSGSGALSVTPSGGGAFTITGTNVTTTAMAGLCLGAGDTITTPASFYVLGYLADMPAAPSSPTRVLQEITNTTTYTVPAGRRLVLTHAMPSTSGSNVQLNVDGVSGWQAVAPGALATASTSQGQWRPLLLSAGQVLAAAAAVNWTISGLTYAV